MPSKGPSYNGQPGSYGEIFWEASRLADDLEKSLHDGKSEECGTLAGESCWDFYIVLSNFVYLF